MRICDLGQICISVSLYSVLLKSYHHHSNTIIITNTKYEYFGASCSTKPDGTVCKPIIHKPNNKEFKQQGGVSSSARIAKLKYDTIRYSTNKYDSLLANLDQSAHVLNRKPVPCRGWRVRGKRPYSADDKICYQLSMNNI